MMINVHSYESMGTFDGPGLRLAFFLQGCNFRCLYCANPDTIAGKGGTPTPPEEIVRMAMSQRPFFGKRGGITFSGGEPTFQAKALVPLVRELKEKGIWFVCADMDGEVMYRQNLTGPIGLVIGNEGNGVSRLVKEKCDFTTAIPMKGDIDSLNASVAAGVLAFVDRETETVKINTSNTAIAVRRKNSADIMR